MAARWSKLVVAAPALVLVIGIRSTAAQIATDGTTGPRVQLHGPEFAIGDDLGTKAGHNLFHSFEKFSLRDGERATFSGPGDIERIISRVTGGERSDIDGTIKSMIDGADFYFINPAGVVFGPNARLDVQGSFHVSSADELRFANGKTFSARTPSSSFTVAAPEAFGFLGANPGAITVDQSVLEVPTGKSLSIVGGDVDIVGGPVGFVRAEAGQITLAAVGGPGEAQFESGAIDAVRKAGIALTDQALVKTSGNGGGTIRIRGDRLLVEDKSSVLADHTGPMNAAGGVEIEVDHVKLSTRSKVTANADDSGNAGRVDVDARSVEIRSGSFFGSDVHSSGDGGVVNVEAGRILISGDGAGFTGLGTDVSSGTGHGGETIVHAHVLRVRDGGVITSSTFGEGRPGSVRLNLGRLVLRDSSFVRSISGGSSPPDDIEGGLIDIWARSEIVISGQERRAAISTSTNGSRNAGSVRIKTPDLRMAKNASIDSSTSGSGTGGVINVEVGRLTMAPGGFVSSNTLRNPSLSAPDSPGGGGQVRVVADEFIEIVGPAAGVTTSTQTAGPAGSIKIVASLLRVLDLGQISSGTTGNGQGGPVVIEAANVEIMGGVIATTSAGAGDRPGKAGGITIKATDGLRMSSSATISAETRQADAGDIVIRVGRLMDLDDSTIRTSVANGTGSGGSIFIDPQFVVLDNSEVIASAARGAGGNIRIKADNLVRSPDSVIDASSDLGIDGTVVISAPEVDLSGGLVVVEGAFLDTAPLRPRCGARRDIGASSFTGVGRGGLPASPDAPLSGAYLGSMLAPGDGRIGEAASVPAGFNGAAVAAAACLGAP